MKNFKLRKILIISPHFPPSNLAAVHRSRLFAQHLQSFGWKPIVLAVHEKYYEEILDWNLSKLVDSNLQIEKVSAFKVTKPRIIGDIGLRAFFQLRKKALNLIKTEGIDFIYIPIPSFYVSLLGNYLFKQTGVKFGIDYIDPWVHTFPGSEKVFSRHWFSTTMAKILEPIALKNVSLITGVAEGYYKGVQQRNPSLLKTCIFGAMPYGGEELDHLSLKGLNLAPYLFKADSNKLVIVYAGALLPKAYEPLRQIFSAIRENQEKFKDVQFHFIGTGKSSNAENSYNVKFLAEEFNLWETIVFEYPKRIPYLDVLVHLSVADAVFILGSTEPHYTPSKTYQAVLCKKPIIAVLHKQSTAVEALRSTKAGIVLSFNGENDIKNLKINFKIFFAESLTFIKSYNSGLVDLKVFEKYSAFNILKNWFHW